MHRGYHQSWLARKILARQPLVTRMARNQLLPQVLGFDGGGTEITERANFSPVPGFGLGHRLVPPLPGSVFRAPFSEKMGYQPEVTAIPYSPGEVQSQRIVESVEANAFEPELPAPGYKEAVQSDNFNESVRMNIQQEQVLTEGFAQPAKAKPSRGRIEESPAETRHAHPLPPSRASGSARRNSQVTRAPQSEDVPVEKTGRGESSADDLFAPRDTDRSPQAWMARLMETRDAAPSHAAFSPAASDTRRGSEQGQVMSNAPLENVQPVLPSGNESVVQRSGGVMLPAKRNKEIKAESQPPIAVRANDAVRSVTPVSQQARRFLRPLVDIDPASTHVYQDTIAERLTDAYQADAITVENDVEMAAGHLNDTPETLGLLAHELTHVARLREPHFIPPIARSEGVTPSMDEEALALRVERRVERAAQEQNGQGVLVHAELIDSASESAAGVTNPPYASRTGFDTWGGLPAPWEPLPDWLVASTATESITPMPAISSQPSSTAHLAGEIESKTSLADGGGDRGGDGHARGTPGPVQRAGRERSADMEQEAQMAISSPSFPADPAKVPEPDLDVLARQVYAHLKRRLEVERRRES